MNRPVTHAFPVVVVVAEEQIDVVHAAMVAPFSRRRST